MNEPTPPLYHRLFGALRAVEVLSLDRPPAMRLNRRGERMLRYLETRRRREAARVAT
jgi:hypothetical protein